MSRRVKTKGEGEKVDLHLNEHFLPSVCLDVIPWVGLLSKCSICHHKKWCRGGGDPARVWKEGKGYNLRGGDTAECE